MCISNRILLLPILKKFHYQIVKMHNKTGHFFVFYNYLTLKPLGRAGEDPWLYTMLKNICRATLFGLFAFIQHQDC